jgi:hypothetical protein
MQTMLDFARAGSSPRGYLIQEFFREAAKSSANLNYAVALMQLWMSFNAWGSLVTGEDTDAEMVRLVGADSDLTTEFQKLFASDKDFRTTVEDFSEFWPIFSNSDIGLQGLWPQMEEWYSLGRAGTARELMRYPNKKSQKKKDGSIAGGIRRRPSNDNFDRSSPSWNDTLEAIYMVRNNLVHGTKGFDVGDGEIIA